MDKGNGGWKLKGLSDVNKLICVYRWHESRIPFGIPLLDLSNVFFSPGKLWLQH
jgi:hypothetical protein